MQNKNVFVLVFVLVICPAFAADNVPTPEDVSAAAVAEYDVSGSLFQQITDMEQEKIMMQLERERAQLDLDLDRLAAEKIKLNMEIDTLVGRAEEQKQEIESARAQLEADAARLEQQQKTAASAPVAAPVSRAAAAEPAASEMSEKYRLVNIVGAGGALNATLEDLQNGQRKNIAVGKTIDGHTVQSISLGEGIVFEKDGETQTLNIGK